MRILVVSDQWFPDYAGGSARVAAETARRLAQRGHDVCALVPSATDRVPLETDGVTVERGLRSGRLPSSVADPFTVYARARRLRGWPDVILAHQSTTAAGAALALPDVPLIRVYHASAAREIAVLRQTAGGRLDRARLAALGRWLAVLERRAMRTAAAVTVLSEYSRRLLLAEHTALQPLVVVIPGGVDTSLFKPNPDRKGLRARLGIMPETRLAVVVRRLDRGVGLDTVVDAMRFIPAPAALAVIGRGPVEPELRRRAASLGAAVRFVGRVSTEELVDWLCAADVAVTSPAVHEGFGLVTVEALACGTPVVGGSVGATSELVSGLDPDLLAERVDPPSFARAMTRAAELAADAAYRERCRAYAAERFEWGRVAADYARLVEDVRSTSARRKTNGRAVYSARP